MAVGHNSYYDGASQSLELPTETGRATVGVMAPGTYEFTAVLDEHVHILEGRYLVRPLAGEWLHLSRGDVVIIAAGTTFEIELPRHAAYLCYYFQPGGGPGEAHAHRIGPS